MEKTAACQYGHVRLAKLLREFGATTNSTAADGRSCFLAACSSGNDELLAAMFDDVRVDEITNTDAKGNSALMLACASGNITLVQRLIEDLGAAPTAKNEDGFTAADLAHAKGHDTITEYVASAIVIAEEAQAFRPSKVDVRREVSSQLGQWTAGGTRVPSVGSAVDNSVSVEPQKRSVIFAASEALSINEQQAALTGVYRRLGRLYAMKSALNTMAHSSSVGAPINAAVIECVTMLAFAAERQAGSAAVEAAATGLVRTCAHSQRDSAFVVEAGLRALRGRLLPPPQSPSIPESCADSDTSSSPVYEKPTPLVASAIREGNVLYAVGRETCERAFASHSNLQWQGDKISCAGTSGRVAQVDLADMTAQIQFESGKYWWPITALSKHPGNDGRGSCADTWLKFISPFSDIHIVSDGHGVHVPSSSCHGGFAVCSTSRYSNSDKASFKISVERVSGTGGGAGFGLEERSHDSDLASFSSRTANRHMIKHEGNNRVRPGTTVDLTLTPSKLAYSLSGSEDSGSGTIELPRLSPGSSWVPVVELSHGVTITCLEPPVQLPKAQKRPRAERTPSAPPVIAEWDVNSTECELTASRDGRIDMMQCTGTSTALVKYRLGEDDTKYTCDFKITGSVQVLVGFALESYECHGHYLGESKGGWGYYSSGGMDIEGSTHGLTVDALRYGTGDTIRVEYMRNPDGTSGTGRWYRHDKANATWSLAHEISTLPTSCLRFAAGGTSGAEVLLACETLNHPNGKGLAATAGTEPSADARERAARDVGAALMNAVLDRCVTYRSHLSASGMPNGSSAALVEEVFRAVTFERVVCCAHEARGDDRRTAVRLLCKLLSSPELFPKSDHRRIIKALGGLKEAYEVTYNATDTVSGFGSESLQCLADLQLAGRAATRLWEAQDKQSTHVLEDTELCDAAGMPQPNARRTALVTMTDDCMKFNCVQNPGGEDSTAESVISAFAHRLDKDPGTITAIPSKGWSAAYQIAASTYVDEMMRLPPVQLLGIFSGRLLAEFKRDGDVYPTPQGITLGPKWSGGKAKHGKGFINRSVFPWSLVGDAFVL